MNEVYVMFLLQTPYGGTNEVIKERFLDPEHQEIDEYGHQASYEHAENYSYLHTGWGNGFDDEEDEESWYEECTYTWKYITKEEFEDDNAYEWED